MSRRLPQAVIGLSEETSVAIAQRVQWADIQLPFGSVATSYVCQGKAQANTPPILCLHGFDSSLFEFRRLLPLLAKHTQVWAVDLLGFGFCDRTAARHITPTTIKQHLLAFCEQIIAQPVVLVGASMGGGVAIDATVSHPKTVKQLVLIDAVGFAAGPAIGKIMFPPLDKWATNFLRNPGVRRKISEKAYYNKSLVTPDAECCAALHLLMPQWQEALISFTKSGGYNFLSPKIPQITPPTLVLWGQQDNILGTKDAARFAASVPDCKLIWLEQCGHVPHLEKPEETAQHIAEFVELHTAI
ncbi:MAG: alpha/beta fold hydrolase [Phormidesmis sp. RL_2_1]|nr:alpha/beta fold hydrolase [Phormidesmis sp. RL_2_1]